MYAEAHAKSACALAPPEEVIKTNDTFAKKLSDDPFTRISNSIFADKRLNIKTLGLLCLCLSLPDDWNFSIRGLVKISGVGQSALMSALDALEALGYLRRGRDQAHQEDGKFGGVQYVFYDTPQTEDAPCVDFPYTGEPYTENQAQEIIKQETKKQEKPPISPKNEKAPMPAELMKRVADYARGDTELETRFMEFAENRRAIKKPIKTDRTLTLLLSKLNELSGGNRDRKLQLIDLAVERNWLSFFPERENHAIRLPKEPPGGFEPEVKAWQ